MNPNSTSSISFKSKNPFLTTTPKKQHLPSLSVFTPKRANPPIRIRKQKSVSDIQSDVLDLVESSSDLAGKRSSQLMADVSAGLKPKGSEKSTALLPEKYEILCEFFNAMVSSIRLLQLKRLSPTFSKLQRNIESLTDRRFTLHHLAQLKHIMPEVITVQKTRVQDEKTNCMKEDLIIKLDFEAVEVDKNVKGQAGFSQLKVIFTSRITDYCTTNPEVDDIPQGELPCLFWLDKQDSKPNTNETPTLLPASHISPSFKTQFSSTVSNTSIPESTFSLIETPIKAGSSKVEDGSLLVPDIQGTPNLLVSTPLLRPPKRSVMSPNDHIDESNNRAKRSRSLKFDESDVDTEEDNVLVQCSIANKDVFDILPKSLLQSVRDNERRLLHEQDPTVSKARRRQQLMASVPKLFDMIFLLFRSIRRSVITKEELIYKIVEGNLDIVDKKEVEDQLTLLQEIAPECLSEQLSLSGDVLLRLNKSLDCSSIRAKLTDAVRD